MYGSFWWLSIILSQGTSSAVVSEATMDVAETSLALAASFTTVPCALLLTDVALSMTLEASRVQHTGKALLETELGGGKLPV